MAQEKGGMVRGKKVEKNKNKARTERGTAL